MRILVWLALGMAAGCGAGAYLCRGMALAVFGAICLVLAFGWGYGSWKTGILRMIPWIFLGAALGCGMFCAYEVRYLAPARAVDGQEQVVTVTIADYPWETDYGWAADGHLTLEGKRYKVRVYLDEAYPVEPGDQVTMMAKLRFTDEGGTREPTYHRTNGILLLVSQRDRAELTGGTPGWREWPGILRQKLKEVLSACVPEDVSAMMKGLVLGDRTGIRYEQELGFRLTGLSHVLSVSGLHLSLLFGVVSKVLGKRRWAALGTVPLVVLIAGVAGFTPSVSRAAVMYVIGLLAMVLRREYDGPTALACAAMGLLGMNPLCVASVGFQLSVLSVAGIQLCYDRMLDWLKGKMNTEGDGLLPRGIGFLAKSMAMSFSATVLTTPLIAVYFGTVSLVGAAANLLVLPVLSLAFYGGVAVCALGTLIPWVGKILGWWVAWPVRWALGMTKALAGFPLAAVYTQNPLIGVWLGLCYGLLTVVLVCKPKRVWPAVSCGVLGLCVALGAAFVEPVLTPYRVTVLDVGQGQSVILQSGRTTFLVDCGGDYEDAAADHAAEALLSMGIPRIDGLILTHYDRDHAGGVALLAERIGIDRLYLPKTEDRYGLLPGILENIGDAERIWVEEELEITFQGGSIRIFPPEQEKIGNESCAAVLFRGEKYDTLITGDLSAVQERRLLATGKIPDLELLVAGHHGSKSATSAELVYRTAPDVVAISVGRDNTYGHPAEEILHRLELYGCEVYRTDQAGDITFRG